MSLVFLYILICYFLHFNTEIVISDIFLSKINLFLNLKKVKNVYLRDIQDIPRMYVQRKTIFSVSFISAESQTVSRAIDLLREKMKEQNAMQRWKGEKEADWDRGGWKKRNRDITFARYRLIGITRFSIVSERVPAGLTFHSPFVAYYPFVTAQDK